MYIYIVRRIVLYYYLIQRFDTSHTTWSIIHSIEVNGYVVLPFYRCWRIISYANSFVCDSSNCPFGNWLSKTKIVLILNWKLHAIIFNFIFYPNASHSIPPKTHILKGFEHTQYLDIFNGKKYIWRDINMVTFLSHVLRYCPPPI